MRTQEQRINFHNHCNRVKKALVDPIEMKLLHKMCLDEKKKKDPVQSEIIEKKDPAVQKIKSIFMINQTIPVLNDVKILYKI